MLFKNEELIFKDHSAFTLIEMLVVILILGILALIIIPQITVTTEDTKLNTLTNNIRIMRSAIELYYHEHGAYPGQKKTDGSGKDEGDNNKAAIAFVDQLTKYTSAIGETSNTTDGTYRYGPYLKFGMPLNPYNENSDIKCDAGEKDITKRTSDGKTGWKFYTKTGVFVANDGSHDNL